MKMEPKIRNNVCLNADPEGCRRMTRQLIAAEEKLPPLKKGPRRVLVIGCSTGYGLSSRIAAAFGGGADTVGVSFERSPKGDSRPGTPGWYNNRTLDEEAHRRGQKSFTFEGDAFSHEMKAQAAQCIAEELGSVDMVIYSLASGIRVDPDTGETYRSVLKPLGQPYTGMTLDVMTGTLSEQTIEPAAAEEAAATEKVMGGEDWQLWIRHLKKEGLLAEGALTLAYSYIGPELTFPLYREGTIGRAKEHLEKTALRIRREMEEVGGDARVSINKALVTRASSVIPAMGPYMAVLFRVMKEKGLHEGCQEQMDRLFREALSGPLPLDKEGRIRMDDWEMRADVQEEVARRLGRLTNENLKELSDGEGFRRDFLQIHGFEVPRES